MKTRISAFVIVALAALLQAAVNNGQASGDSLDPQQIKRLPPDPLCCQCPVGLRLHPIHSLAELWCCSRRALAFY